jgi:hypothetical protein
MLIYVDNMKNLNNIKVSHYRPGQTLHGSRRLRVLEF